MFSMNTRRLLIFLSIVVAVFFFVKHRWDIKSPTEKWMEFNKYPAQDYANKVLGPARGTHVPVPDELSGNNVDIRNSYVIYAPKQSPELILAFAPAGKPPADNGKDWLAIGDSWYILVSPTATGSAAQQPGK